MQKMNSVSFDKIITYQYIIDCAKLNVKLDTENYELFNSKTEEKSIQQLQKTNKYRHLQETDDQANFNENEVDINSAESRTLSLKNIVKHVPTQNTQKKYIKGNPDPKKFACQKGDNKSPFETNQYIQDQLLQLCAIYQNQKDVGRRIAYLKAASAVKCYNKQIINQSQIRQIRGIGPKIQDKIKQILQTGQIQKLQKFKNRQQNVVCQQLTRIWGIGVNKAKDLYSKGITSIEKLKQNQDLLSKTQSIGLKYFQQFQKRIPRDKVTRIFDYVKQKIYQLVGSKDLHKIQVCGSYRRGKPDCGDIDILICRKDHTFENGLLPSLILKLQKQKFLTDHLTIPSSKAHNNSSMSYMGVCIFQDQTHHRIDLKYYPHEQFAFAILYFTGNDMFNRSMRLFARKKGYSLSDHGLVEVERNGQSEKIWKGPPVNLYTEDAIFQYLGLEYKSPSQRDI